MANARTPGKWPYRAAKPSRMRRVIKMRSADDTPLGVQRRNQEPSRPLITPMRARLVLLAAMISAIVAGAWYAYHSPWLTVQRVTVTGTSTLAEDDVRAAAALDGQSTFGLDVAGANARVSALNGVRGVTVTKHGWSAVTIAVDERTVWGSWQMNGVNVPIDDEGYVLSNVTPAYGTPAIVEIDPKRVVNAGDRLDGGAVDLAVRLMRDSKRSFGRNVLGLVYRQDSGLTAILSAADGDAEGHPLWVTFGDSRDYDYKVAALYALTEQARQSDIALNVADLRFGDRLSFK